MLATSAFLARGSRVRMATKAAQTMQPCVRIAGGAKFSVRTLAVASVASLVATAASSRKTSLSAASPFATINSAHATRWFNSSAAAASSGAPWHSCILTIAGPDRAGIVHDLASQIQELGANIEESRMTVLGNDFAVILRLSSPASLTAEELRAAIASTFPSFLVASRLTEAPPPFTYPVRILNMSLEGPDQPGIVRQFTSILADFGASVRDLDTDTSSAPFAGYKLFSLKCVVAMPTDFDVDAFDERIAAFESEFGFDVSVEETAAADEEEGEEGEEEQCDDPSHDHHHHGHGHGHGHARGSKGAGSR